MIINNIMTVDLEEWFHANYREGLFDNSKNYEVRIVSNTERLLKIFKDSGVKATFFVLGSVGEKHPDLIKLIDNFGHELASHGYAHQLVYNQTKEEFRDDVRRSVAVVENITNKKVLGYRAPSWSITSESFWALEVLCELGMVYDSSIFPVKTFLYGIKDSPLYRHNPILNGRTLQILEIPPSPVEIFGLRIAFCGGFYFRLLPCFLIKSAFCYLNKKGNNGMLYIHPREIDQNQPKLDIKGFQAFIHYYGVKNCAKKLNKILETFKFTSISDSIGESGDKE